MSDACGVARQPISWPGSSDRLRGCTNEPAWVKGEFCELEDVTSSTLLSLKVVKMLGLSGQTESVLQSPRAKELAIGKYGG